MPLRVIIDANVFLSFLLFPEKQTAVVRVVTRTIAGDFELVFPPEVESELRRKVREKPYFRERVRARDLDELLGLIQDIATVPSGDAKAPIRSRDPKDQYLLDAAAGDGVAFLISGDSDLLDIERRIDFPPIVSAASFLYLMDSEFPEP